ncbi:MAG: cation-translocating P-type ATPase [Candidatus Helarchaeales archaeon]
MVETRKEQKMDEKHFHSMPIEKVFQTLETSEKGLSTEEVLHRQEKYGFNELKEKEKRTLWDIFIGQFKDFLILLLIAAMIISFVIFLYEIFINHEDLLHATEWIDIMVIAAIILANAIIGTKQEYSSEKSLEALKKLAAPHAKVIRNGEQVEVWSRELVPGDILVLNTGDKISADIRLIEAVNLKIEEAALTGESVPTKKTCDVIPDPNVPITQRKNMAYSSTIVTYGRGKGIVIATGMNTEIGKIAEMIQTAEEKQTPLQKKLDKLGKMLGLIIILICAIVFIAGFTRLIVIHLPTLSSYLLSGNLLEGMLDMFTAAVGLAVAAVPEGLPAIVTISLSLGVRRMVEKNAIIRKLPAVETLGCATVICSDKTGTLTQNEMTVRKIFVDDKLMEVTGAGYAPEGHVYYQNEKISLENAPDLKLLLRIAALCNDASLVRDPERKDSWKIIGDPTEGALLTAAAKMDLWKQELEKEFPRVGEVPFDSERKRMTTIHPVNGKLIAHVKGAPERILEQCTKIRINGNVIPITKDHVKRVLDINSEMAHSALRVLAYACKEVPKQDEYDEQIEQDLIFVGLSGMIDPPREEVKAALIKVERAGMQAKMITGDNQETAVAIAKELGFDHGNVRSMTGMELNQISDQELVEKVETISVFARTSPEHKVRICNALKEIGHVVAMTGDGVNDAPALKNADIGIAMGITGTDVTKEASDMILTDDNFATIVNAIEEGRAIYDNIRKFIFYLLSSNTGEILTMFFGIMLGFHYLVLGPNPEIVYVLPLTAISILWINLVTDGLPATAMSVDPPDPDLMERNPRDPNESVISRLMFFNMIIIGVTMCIGTLWIIAYGLVVGQFLFYNFNLLPPALQILFAQNRLLMIVGWTFTPKKLLPFGYWAMTLAFTTLVMFQLYNVFSCRSQRLSIFQIKTRNKSLWIAVLSSFALQLIVVYLPPLNFAFGTVPLSMLDWILIFAISSTIIVSAELFKLCLRKKEKRDKKKLREKFMQKT